MPVLHALGYLNHVAGLKQARGLAPLLVPAGAADADEHLYAAVMDVPVVAATRLEGDVAHGHLARRERRQVATAYEILGVGRVRLALGEHRSGHGAALIELFAVDLGYGLAGAPGLNVAHPCGQHGGDGAYLGVCKPHVAGPADVRLKLGGAALESGQRADGDQLALGVGEIVAGEDVAEEVRLEIIVGGGGEVVIEGPSSEARLHLGALPQGVVAGSHGRGVAALVVGNALRLALVEHALQGAQGVKAAGEAGVGVELREGFLHLTDGQSGVEALAYGLPKALDVALGLEARYGDDGLLFFV